MSKCLSWLYSRQDEIKAIIKQRTTFEYALARKSPKKSDFLRSIEYEMNLDSLRKKRIKRLGIKVRKMALAAYAISRRITYLFDRFSRRFPSDVSIWVQYINYVRRQKSRKVSSKVMTRSLQLHPGDARLWILAAACEFQDNLNVVAARALMQRGLRLNYDSRDLWLEYFRMEMIYIEKLKLRRKILGIDADKSNIVDVDHSASDSDDSMNGDEGMISLDNFDDESDQETKRQRILTEVRAAPDLENQPDNPLLRGDVAIAIFKAAAEALPNDWQLLCDFIEICSEMATDTQHVTETIISSLQERFATTPKVRSYLAQRPVNTIENIRSSEYVTALRTSVASFQSAIEDVPSSEMYEEYVSFLDKEATRLAPLARHDTAATKTLTYTRAAIRKVASQACQKGHQSSHLYKVWMASAADVHEIAAQALSYYPSDADIWMQYLKHSAPQEQYDVYKNAIQALPRSCGLWTGLIEHIKTQWRQGEIETAKVEEKLRQYVLDVSRLVSVPGTIPISVLSDETSSSLDAYHLVIYLYLMWTLDIGGSEHLMSSYQDLRRRIKTSSSFFVTMLKVVFGSVADSGNVIAIFDLLVDAVLSERKLATPQGRTTEDLIQVYIAYLGYLVQEKQESKVQDLILRARRHVAPMEEEFDRQSKYVFETAQEDSDDDEEEEEDENEDDAMSE